jgi:hypothetical protein
MTALQATAAKSIVDFQDGGEDDDWPVPHHTLSTGEL